MGRFMKKHQLTLFILPALLFYSVFTLAPAIGGIVYSFTNWNGLAKDFDFIGLRNYITMLSDKDFINAVLFTLKFVGIMVVLQNVVALALALMIESRNKTKALFRTLLFMPNMLSMIIGGFMWMFIFTRALPYIAQQLNLAQLANISWIGDPNFSFIAIIIVSLWGGVGYLMIIYIAALQGVDHTLKEAASIDGATPFQTLTKVVCRPSCQPSPSGCL
jgi:raffinose/stachyose/melibiose transport system permease protein